MKPARIVTIAGMRQSGSTLTYNIVLNLYQLFGIPVACGYVTRLEELVASEQRHVLVKSHEFNELLHGSPDTFVITVKRDLRDTVASRFRRFARLGRAFERNDASDALRIAEEQVGIYESLQDRSDFEFVYETYKADSRRVVADLALVVFGVTYPRKIKRAINRAEKLHTKATTPERSQHKEGTSFERHLLSRSHVTNAGRIGGYGDALRTDEVAAINHVFGGWLRSNGYSA